MHKIKNHIKRNSPTILSIVGIILVLSVITTIGLTVKSIISGNDTTVDEPNEEIVLEPQDLVFDTQGDIIPDVVDNPITDFEIMQQYWYVIRDAQLGKGVDFSLIKYTDSLCREKNVNAHLIWAIVRTESRYDASATNNGSSARGLGQFLKGTATYIYETYLGNGEGSYNHDMAFDPYINIQLMVGYMNYLQNKYDTTQAMLREYSGKKNDSYFNVLTDYMSPLYLDSTVNTYISN